MAMDGGRLEVLLVQEVLRRIKTYEDIDVAVHALVRAIVAVLGQTVMSLPEEEREGFFDQGAEEVANALKHYKWQILKESKKKEKDDKLGWFARRISEKDMA
jgi:hypothetical protein